MTRRLLSLIAFAYASALLDVGVGCGSSASSGQSVDQGGTTATPSSGSPGTFTSIYAMMFPARTNGRCNFCHGLPENETSNGRLHFGEDQASAYAALVGKASISTGCNGRVLVIPGDPDQSLLLEKLTETPPCGSRMPLGGALLTDAQREEVRSWIAAGAKDD